MRTEKQLPLSFFVTKTLLVHFRYISLPLFQANAKTFNLDSISDRTSADTLLL